MPVLRSDIGQKIKNIGTKGLPYVAKGIKRFIKGKEETFDFLVLDLKAVLDHHKIIRADTRDYIRNNIEIKVVSGKDPVWHDDILSFSSQTAGIPEQFTEYIFKNECMCFLALADHKIVGMACLAYDEYPVHIVGLNLVLGNKQMYRFHSFVDERYRGHGIISYLWVKAIDFAVENGYAHMIGAIRQWNKASYGITEKLGFGKYATATLHERFFIQRHEFRKLADTEAKTLSLRLPSGKMVAI